jgi:hypothetical protein
MAKKRVPDWLNSPLWSSPSEQHRFSSAVPEPPEPPSPPPLTIKQDPPSIQHSRTNHNHNNNHNAIVTSSHSSSSSSASTSSADENSHSRQAQCQANLLAEVPFTVSLHTLKFKCLFYSYYYFVQMD